MKSCLLIANKNAITLKEVFPLIKNKILRVGYTVPKDYDQPKGCDYKSLQGLTRWMTTLSVSNKPPLILTATYDPALYPKYDNYDAINVDKVKDIPYDYEGVMGVPITILGYALENVEIIGSGTADCLPEGYSGMTKEFVDLYYSQGNTGSYKEGNRIEHYIKDGKAIIPYKRILIKKNFEIIGSGGADLDKEVFEEYLQQGHSAHYGKQLLIYRRGDKLVMPFHRLIIRRKEK